MLLAPEARVPGLRPLRLAAFDLYQSRLPRARHAAPAVIVAIDETSLQRHGQWPWPRVRLAELVARITEARPAAVGLDILMPEPDRLSPGRLAEMVNGLDAAAAAGLRRLPSNDAVLAATIRGRAVVVALAGVDVAGAAPTPYRPPVRAFGGDPLRFLRAFDGALRNLDEIDAAAAGHGLLSVDVERGVVRRAPLVAGVAGALVPGLGVEMLRVAAGVPALAVRVGAGGVETVGVGDLAIPTGADGGVWIHYSPHDPDRFVSAADVLDGRVAAAQLERKLVLVGVTALALADYQATPVADQMPGVEIHAQLLEDIFDGTLLVRPRWALGAEAGLLAVAGLLVIFAVPRLPARTSAVLGVLLLAVIAALGFSAYAAGRLLLDWATPAGSVAVLFTVMLLATLVEAEGQRRALRLQIERQREAAARVAGELEAARRIQRASLPLADETFPGETRFDLYAFLEPAREVGGDLYDFFPLGDDRVFFMIGDVSGKGVPGSLFMAVSKALCKSVALRQEGRPAAVLREADAEISRDNGAGLFVTAFAGALDAATGELEYCNAGHERPYLLPCGDRALVPLDGGGPPLCTVDGFPYAVASRTLAPGDTLCLVTDGVTEAANAAGELYGRRRLEALLRRLGDAPDAAAIGEAVRRDVAGFGAGVDAADDMAILVLRWRGPAPTGR